MEFKATEQLYHSARLSNYLSLAGVVLTLIDLVQTMRSEAQLIWPMEFSLAKLVVLCVRYGNIVYSAVTYIYVFAPQLSDTECRAMSQTLAVLAITLTCLGEGIMYIRTWAFSGCSPRMKHYLIVQFAVMCCASYALVGRYLASLRVASTTPLPVDFPCFILGGGEEYASAVYSLLLVSLTSLMGVILFIALSRYRQYGMKSIGNNDLFSQFYRDGFAYFLMLFGLSATNIFIHQFATNGYQFIFVRLQVSLHSILSVRMVLHLREYIVEREAYQLCGGTGSSGFDETQTALERFIGSGPAVIPGAVTR